MLETKKIGNKIAEARKRANLSQALLAEQLFISQQAVGKWERGESMPDITTFNRLAELFGVDFNYFLEDFSSPSTGSGTEELTEKKTSESSKMNIGKMNWDMSRGNWIDADFSGLKNLNEKFSSSNMQRCKFNGSDLSGLQLKNNNVDSCDFTGSDISNSHIHSSNLKSDLFNDSTLNGTEFSGSNMERCNFTNARLIGTSFSRSNLYGCNFTGADLTGVVIKSGGFSGEKLADTSKNFFINTIWNRTSLINSQIADIVFTGTLEECYFENCEFTRVTFNNAVLINTFFKNNEKLKKVKFIDCKADRITYEFLKQGKADITGIVLIEISKEETLK